MPTTTMPSRLTIVYDETCAFCCWCRDRIVGQDLLVPVTLRPRSDPHARRRWGHIPGYGQEVFVADDRGNCWVGPPAFVMALWATRAWRDRSHDLTGPAARQMLGWLSQQRHRLSALMPDQSAGDRPGSPDSGCHDGPCQPEPLWTTTTPPPPTGPRAGPGPR